MASNQSGRVVDADAARSALFRTSLVLGVGAMGVLDTVLFHQLLQWHNFYVHADAYWRIASDGILHFLLATMLFFGAMRFWAQRRALSRLADGRRTLLAGLLLGMGGFQLFDGTVDHKLLRLHPIREGVADQLPYDLAWNGVALALLAAGWLLARRGERAEDPAERLPGQRSDADQRAA